MSYGIKVRSALAIAATVLMCGSAQAGFIFLDNSAPTATLGVAVPGINNFQSQLAANGVSEFFSGVRSA